MNFQEALKIALTGKNVIRKCFHFDRDGYQHDTEWAEWIRLRLDSVRGNIPSEDLIAIEMNNYDEEKKVWLFADWWDEQLTRADVDANDWIIMEDE
jgi:hypothetical protein